jgi:hypothetical protein
MFKSSFKLVFTMFVYSISQSGLFMQMMSKKYLLLILFPVLVLMFNGCKKEVESKVEVTNTFMHVYPEQGGQVCSYIKPTDDNGCMLFVNEDLRSVGDGKKLSIIKLDENGKVEWKKTIDNIELPNMVNCTVTKDGSLLFSNDGEAGKIVKINNDGSLAWVNDYSYMFGLPNFFYSTYIVEGDDGILRTAVCNGQATYAARAFLFSFNQDGSFLGSIPIRESSFGVTDFKLVYLSMYKYGNGQTQYYAGLCFLHDDYTFHWGERFKLFVNKMVFYDDSTLAYSKTVILDSASDDNNYTGWGQRYINKERALLINTTVVDKFNISRGQIIKVNDLLEVVWKSDIRITPYGTSLNYGCEDTRDGNYLVTGSCKVPGKLSSQPFAAKLDKNGKIIWSKIFQTNLAGTLTYGMEMIKGDFILTGTTTGFGLGNTGADLYILKTDKDLNYKD